MGRYGYRAMATALLLFGTLACDQGAVQVDPVPDPSPIIEQEDVLQISKNHCEGFQQVLSYVAENHIYAESQGLTTGSLYELGLEQAATYYKYAVLASNPNTEVDFTPESSVIDAECSAYNEMVAKVGKYHEGEVSDVDIFPAGSEPES